MGELATVCVGLGKIPADDVPVPRGRVPGGVGEFLEGSARTTHDFSRL